MKLPFTAHPIIDGYLLTESPYNVYRKENQNDVDVLIGFNHDEGLAFITHCSISAKRFTQQLERQSRCTTHVPTSSSELAFH